MSGMSQLGYTEYSHETKEQLGLVYRAGLWNTTQAWRDFPKNSETWHSEMATFSILESYGNNLLGQTFFSFNQIFPKTV